MKDVLADGLGRKIEYMRISVTDKCNLRCRYCMPEERVKSVAHEDLLTYEEIAFVTGILAEMGVCKVRLTGGEPLVRKDIAELVDKLHSTKGIETIAMTSNGVLLKSMLPELVSSGLNEVNISLDTLNADHFERITRTACLNDVLDGIDSAITYGLKVKLNCVPCRELNDEDVLEVAEMAQGKKLDVRFIELMPIGQGKLYTGISSDLILERLTLKHGTPKELPYDGQGPARYYSFDGFNGRIGFISPISHMFCSSCNRIRLMPEGMLKPCLYYPDGLDIRGMLRRGEKKEIIKTAVTEMLQRKHKEHGFGNGDTGNAEEKRMNQIGG